MASNVVILTTSEVAKRWKVSSSTVRRWVELGLLKPVATTPGGHHRFAEEDVVAFLDPSTHIAERSAS